MATKKLTNSIEREQNFNDLSGSFGFKELTKPVPTSAKFGRSYGIQRKEVQLTLFSSLEDKQKEFTLSVGNIQRGVSLLSIKRVDFALRELLYRQSYQMGNLEQNTGVAKDGVLFKTSPEEEAQIIPPTRLNGKDYYVGEILVRLGELSLLAFGKDDNHTRKLTENVLKAMQEGIIARNAFGDEKRRSLLWLRGHDYDSKTNAKLVDIVLHAIYAKDVNRNFALHRSGILNQIGTITDAKLDLLELLGLQDKRTPFRIYTGTLLEKLSLVDEYKKNKARTKKKLAEAISSLVGKDLILLEEPETKLSPKGDIVEYIFHLNPNYGKTE